MPKKYEKKGLRKEYADRGSRGQKMVNFRCDWDNIKILDHVENKGRFINTAIKEWGRRNRIFPDADPSENDIEDYMP